MPGEGGRNVTLAVNCSQDNAILTWSNGGLPYLQEVTIFSSCINPTNTSEVCYTMFKYALWKHTNEDICITFLMAAVKLIVLILR